jgi:hypothetical protein
MARKAVRAWRAFSRAGPHLVVLIAQVWGLLFFAAPLRVIEGFPLDDAWIHQVVARTFAKTGTLGYAAGHHGAGATSCLWALLLSLNFLFVHRAPFIFTLVVNVTLSLLAGQLLLLCFQGSRRDGATALRCAGSVALACIGGNFIWFAFSGMEANLVIVLSLLCAMAWAQIPGMRGALLAGFAAGALALTRPECAALAPLVALFTRRVNRPRGDLAWLLVPWAACLAGYFGVNLMATGHAMPSTLGGRLWLSKSSNPGLSSYALARDFLATVAQHLRDYTLGTSSMEAFWIGLGLAGFAYIRLVRERQNAIAIVLAWTALHFASYAVLLPTPGHAGRYVPLTPLVYLAGVGYGSVLLIESAWSFVGRLLPRFASIPIVCLLGAGALAPWFGLVGVGIRDWRLDDVRATSHIRWTEEGLGPLVDALPAGAKVASFDIGGVGFRAHRPIVDLGGLSDPSTSDSLRRGMVWQLLRDQQIDYVIVPVGFREQFPDITNLLYRLRLAENSALKLEPVAYRESPLDTWVSGWQATWNSSPRQEVFHIAWTGQPGPGPVGAPLPRTVVDPEGLLSRWGRANDGAALGMLAEQGVELSLELALNRPLEVEIPPPPGWRAVMGPWGFILQGPPQDADLEPYVRGMLVDWTEPYLVSNDFDGAALAATHAFATAWRTRRSPTFYPLLPPLAGPAPGGIWSPMEASTSSGLPLALVFTVVGLLLEWLSRRGIPSWLPRWRRRVEAKPLVARPLAEDAS